MQRLQLTLKRCLDIILCSILLISGIPIFIGLALLVRVSSPGPVLFIQTRIGKKGKQFEMFKFRTMQLPPKHYVQSSVWTCLDEQRITPIGNVLRDFGLDELPQVINIIKGEMSIVGPRPILVEQYNQLESDQLKYLDMRPGVITYSSVNGRRSRSFDEKVKLNIWYVNNWSLWLDIKIMFQAIFVILLRKNARFPQTNNNNASRK